ncbi:cytochrome c oxidase subunit 8A, mitochondrial [Notolabrus celidotus]|uniref:cytochrome c oxidase subunit 8A, mitochondrial n=1 Tax=Notolabrus celidotus TaxID=1203425 RepID=UPI00148FDDA2|nr:cytochrome c oxidase subunit 8A, mitochondrial [Notolabrus celidotus]
MSGLLRTIATRATCAAPSLRPQTVMQRASIYSRPAKGKVGAVETAIGISMFSLAILGPAGWILSHLEEYKTKE